MNACVREVTRVRRAELEPLLEKVLERVGRRVRALEIDEDGGLVLRGWAPSYYVKQMVQQAVMELSDRPIRANEIEVG